MEGNAPFFVGYAERADVVAAGLLAVASVAASRFYEPFHLVAKRIIAADPVVTYDGASLRFEAFSVCGSVHARFDVDADGLDVEAARTGTTNVDVNPPMSSALSGVLVGDPMRISVGADELAIDLVGQRVVEKRVPLPSRWVRGFGETQVQQRGMKPYIEASGPAVQGAFASLPRAGKTPVHLAQVGPTVRMLPRAQSDAVPLVGADRLQSMTALARLAERIVVSAPATRSGPIAASSWELAMPHSRLTLTLSAEPSRGFSGDGGLLESLSDESLDDAEGVVDALAQRPVTTDEQLEGIADASRCLDVLAATGRVGYDLGRHGSFLRPLPLGEAAESLNPRLSTSRALVDTGAVEFTDEERLRARVRSDGHHHVVQLAAGEPAGASCTCPWFARHHGGRGPCKHVLATVAQLNRVIADG